MTRELVGDVHWQRVRCALCGEDAPRPLLLEKVARGGQNFAFQVVACRRCGFVYVNPRGEGAVFGNLAGGAARRDAAEANAAIYASGVAHLRGAGLPPGGRLLDLGCARGDFLAFCQAHGLEAVGVDLNPGLADEARARGFQVVVGDLREVIAAGRLAPGFDALTMWDVIEHVDDPVAVLAAARAAVRPGGLVLFHTGNARFQLAKARLVHLLRPGAGSTLIPYQHVSHFDPRTARRALEAAGLEPIDVFFAGTLHYRQAPKRLGMRAWNLIAAGLSKAGWPLWTNAMAVVGRRPMA